jgi:hypothetical protein
MSMYDAKIGGSSRGSGESNSKKTEIKYTHINKMANILFNLAQLVIYKYRRF